MGRETEKANNFLSRAMIVVSVNEIEFLGDNFVVKPSLSMSYAGTVKI
jgi:hypothetical protein